MNRNAWNTISSDTPHRGKAGLRRVGDVGAGDLNAAAVGIDKTQDGATQRGLVTPRTRLAD